MRIRNIRTSREFEINNSEWNIIINNGNSYKYQILEDDTPIEIKSLRISKGESTNLPKKKTIK